MSNETVSNTDFVGRLIAREIEKAYREGWSTGYNAGWRDGGSDSTWCDGEKDWRESETVAALRSQVTPHEGDGLLNYKDG